MNKMKRISIAVALVVILSFILMMILGKISQQGEAAGLEEGKLLQCPDKSNCVCSEYKKDAKHYIDPIILPQDITKHTLTLLKEAILEKGGVIQSDMGIYLAGTFSSYVFGFVDDLEIRVVPEKRAIHIRSASRIGQYDFGVNKKRVQNIKSLFFIKRQAERK